MKIGHLTLLVLSAAALLRAQIGTSAFTGTVTDLSGAIVPRAQVEAVNIETNFRTTGVTNAEGLYRIQSLQPGPYRLQFSAPALRPSCAVE
jgi:protocatechuate 3,4-dioxygenase beta subunit